MGRLFVDMSSFEHLRAVATVARQLPAAWQQPGCRGVRAVDHRSTRSPVVLVHGYAGTEAVWSAARCAMREAGFGHIISLAYNSFAADPDRVCAELVHLARQAYEASGAPGVHLVGHSLGGVLVRRALAESAELAAATITAVTIASPHRGARLARIAPGPCARIMHPARRPGVVEAQRTRWVAYYSDRDRIVPTASARLDDDGYHATNVLIPDCGHLTICQDARLIRSLVSELIRTETTTVPSALSCAA